MAINQIYYEKILKRTRVSTYKKSENDLNFLYNYKYVLS